MARAKKGSCVVTDIQPAAGAFKVTSAPTSIRWTIYNTCPGTQLVRIAAQGPTNPFRDCPGRPEMVAGVPFQVPSSRGPAVDVTCTLVANPCTAFGIDVNTFPVRQYLSCATTSGQIEIDPW